MKVYLVGGAVRDRLLGLESKDNDYVVVGSSPEYLESLGFKQVGNDFPVFLHPETGDEYALARKERKSGKGYGGFICDFSSSVSLEDDLFRRDLTINAMALDESGNIIDPFFGQKDLQEKVLRHVSPHFAEDPLRLLRVCRFHARYAFEIATETKDLLKDIVLNNEIEALTAERVWKEFEKSMTEPFPHLFFKALSQVGALDRLAGLNKALNYFDDLRKITHSDEQMKVDLRISYIFSFVSKDDIEKYKITADQKKLVGLWGVVKNPDFGIMNYSALSPEDKVSFINKTKAIHGLDTVFALADAVFAINDIDDVTAISLKEQLGSDVLKLKSLNMEEISNNAKFNKLNIKDEVFNSQVGALVKKSKLKM